MAQVEEKRKKKQLEEEQRKWEEQEEEQRLAREKEQMQKQFEEDMLKQKQKEVGFCIFFSADSCNKWVLRKMVLHFQNCVTSSFWKWTLSEI